MAKPRLFLSSTYLDNRDTRDSVFIHLTERGFEVKAFERGGVYFEPGKSLDESCYDEVKDSHIAVAIIGNRYGTPAFGETAGKKFKSITRREIETALETRLHVVIFVRREVAIEYQTFKKTPKVGRDAIRFNSVDSTQVFELLDDLYQVPGGIPILKYDGPTDLITQLDKQLLGVVAQVVTNRKASPRPVQVRVNGLKLFYFRRERGLSQRKLSERASVSKVIISKLEQVDLRRLEETTFNTTTSDIVHRLEQALNCSNELAAGRPDDFRTTYVSYYGLYRGQPPTERNRNHAALFPARVIVFDFDGTLTAGLDTRTTWERLWVHAGYTINDCDNLANKYMKGGKVSRTDHLEWCAATCETFKAGRLAPRHLSAVAKELKLVDGAADVLQQLRERGIKLYVVSGSVAGIIHECLGDTAQFFEEIHANHIQFDNDGRITSIVGTPYDFEGKGDFIRSLITKKAVSPLEILFIGNSHNDVFAGAAGVRTLCVNPAFTDHKNTTQWTHAIRELAHLAQILPFVDATAPWPSTATRSAQVEAGSPDLVERNPTGEEASAHR